MQYIIATTEGQQKNEFGGQDWRLLLRVDCADMRAATKEAAKHGQHAKAMTPSEWAFLSSAESRAAVKAAR